MPEGPEKQKHIKAVTLNQQERIVLAHEKTKERLLVTDFFKEVLTAAVNANSKSFLQQVVLSLNENTSDRLVRTLRDAISSGGITDDSAVDAAKIVEHFKGETPKPEGLETEVFCQKVLDYLAWKKENDEIVLQLMRDVYVHDRGLKKGILLEVSMQAGKLLAEEEANQAKPGRFEPKPNITTVVLDNLKMSSESEQDKLDNVKTMIRVFWPGMTGDLPATALFQKLDGKQDKLDKEQVFYWPGFLGVAVKGENTNKPYWFDCFFKDRTQEVNGKRDKETELLMANLHETDFDALLAEETETVVEKEDVKPDDSRVLYGAGHKVMSREPIRLQDGVKISELKTRLTYEPPQPEGRKTKIDYYAFIYPILPDYKDPELKQVLGFNELLIASFFDDRDQSHFYFIIRTRKEFESLVRKYSTFPLGKLRVCELDPALRNALPPNVLKDPRMMVYERMRSFLAQNRATTGAILDTLKGRKAEALISALQEFLKAQQSPDGRFTYDLWNCLKKVLAAKQGVIAAKQEFQTQQEIQNKLLVQTQNEIKTNQTPQRIMAFKAKLAAQVKITQAAKLALEGYVRPLFEMVNQGYQARQLQPKPAVKTLGQPKPPKPALPGQTIFPWETVTPWEKMRQLAEFLAEKAKTEMPGVNIVLKLPETDKDVADRNIEDLLTFLHDFAVKSGKGQASQMGMVMAETLADYLGSLDADTLQQMTDALARMVEETSQPVQG